MAWNPNDYDMVEVRIRRFLDENVDGRLISELVPDDENWVFRAYVYLSVADQEGNWPKATGYATEKKSSSQFSAEVAETSAIGRALANMGLHGNKRASREEMRKVPNPDRDFITESKSLKDADALRLLWTEAKAAGADVKVLDEVKQRAERLQSLEGERPGVDAGLHGGGSKK
jgi:hypothetical protein